jgi:hypothetical protein
MRLNGAAIRESLLAGVDAAFIDVVPSKWSARANTLRQFRIFKEIRAAERCCLSLAFSSEVDTGSREENASKQESRASVLIQSEPKML